MLNRNQENMPVIFPSGLKILCDGYVISGSRNNLKELIFNDFLCDGYVMILQ
jgi:hypothetical protein